MQPIVRMEDHLSSILSGNYHVLSWLFNTYGKKCVHHFSCHIVIISVTDLYILLSLFYTIYIKKIILEILNISVESLIPAPASPEL